MSVFIRPHPEKENGLILKNVRCGEHFLKDEYSLAFSLHMHARGQRSHAAKKCPFFKNYGHVSWSPRSRYLELTVLYITIVI